MTRVQFLSLLSAAGVGFLGGTVTFRAGPPASVLYTHALRVESKVIQLSDGGYTADNTAPATIIAYRTRASLELDGGALLTDEGPHTCTGDVSPLFTWAARACSTASDGGAASVVRAVRVVELRPAATFDAGVALEVYGATSVRCIAARPPALALALGAFVCTPVVSQRAFGAAL